MASLKSLFNKIPGFKDLPGDGFIMKLISLLILIIVLFYLVKIVMSFFNKSEGFEGGDDDDDDEEEDMDFDNSMYSADLGFENENIAEDERAMDYEMDDVAPVSDDLVEGMTNKGSKKGAAASSSTIADTFKKAFKLSST